MGNEAECHLDWVARQGCPRWKDQRPHADISGLRVHSRDLCAARAVAGVWGVRDQHKVGTHGPGWIGPTDGDVVPSRAVGPVQGQAWGWGFGGGLEVQVGKAHGALIHGHDAEAAVILPGRRLQLG